MVETYHSAGQHPHCVTILAKLSLPPSPAVYLKTLPHHSTPHRTARTLTALAPAPRPAAGGDHSPAVELWSNTVGQLVLNMLCSALVGRQIGKNRKTPDHLPPVYQHQYLEKYHQ